MSSPVESASEVVAPSSGGATVELDESWPLEQAAATSATIPTSRPT
jgi:hypothetical protein